MYQGKVRETVYFLNFSFHSPLMDTSDRSKYDFIKVQDEETNEFTELSYRT